MQFKQQLNHFFPNHQCSAQAIERRYIVVAKDKLAWLNGKLWMSAGEAEHFADIHTSLVMGQESGIEYHCVDAENLNITSYPEAIEWLGLRALAPDFDDVQYALAASALQLSHWRFKHKFCGCCGEKLTVRSDERAMSCTVCGNREYPKVHPCIIVRVLNQHGEILLARSPHFKPGLYSNVAGFIEPGESAEKAVYREVVEEVGIRVKNIRYLGSQSWPFPSQIMLAFEAEYDSGDIQVDGVEIEDAQWWSLNELPSLPNNFSISGWLIQSYIDANQNQEECKS